MKGFPSFRSIQKPSKQKTTLLRFTHLFEKTNNRNKYNVSNFGNKWASTGHYLLAVGLSVFVIYIKLLLNPLLGNNTPFLLLFSAIIFSGWVGGLGPGVIATLATAWGVLMFFLPGVNSNNSSAFLQVAVFILEGVLISILLDMRRRLELVLKERLTHQAVLTELGQYALVNPNISSLFKKANKLLIETFRVQYVAIWQYIPEKNALLLQSGIGWKNGVVGKSKILIDKTSYEGRAFLEQKEAVVYNNDSSDVNAEIPPQLKEYGIISGMSIIIPGATVPFGVLSIYKTKKESLRQGNRYFLQSISHVLATAVEKANSEKALRESQIKFQKLFDSNVIGITIVNQDGILDANDTFLNLLGYKRNELKELRWQTITPQEYAEADERALKELEEKGYCVPFEKEYIRKDENRVPILIGAIMLEKIKKQWICFILDVTKQKELEKRKDDFISIASHELKTPVTSLKVFTQLMQKKMKEEKNPVFTGYLNKMDNQVNKLTELINDLLNVTKIQKGKLEFHTSQFYLQDVINDVLENMQPTTTNHKITFTNRIKHAIVADRDRIEQVIINLLSNAIKYSPAGGNIAVTTQEKDGFAIVSVKDSGIGIDKKYETAIFERFFRVNEGKDKNYPGLGIGLFFSSEIIKRHKGKMWVESEKEKGSTFYFSLPLPKRSI